MLRVQQTATMLCSCTNALLLHASACCNACSTWVMVNLQTRKVAKIPDEMRQKLARFAPDPLRHVLCQSQLHCSLRIRPSALLQQCNEQFQSGMTCTRYSNTIKQHQLTFLLAPVCYLAHMFCFCLLCLVECMCSITRSSDEARERTASH